VTGRLEQHSVLISGGRVAQRIEASVLASASGVEGEATRRGRVAVVHIRPRRHRLTVRHVRH